MRRYDEGKYRRMPAPKSHGACEGPCMGMQSHLPERCEALVDGHALLEAHPLEARVLWTLRAREIDKVELGTERPASDPDWSSSVRERARRRRRRRR